MGSKYPLAFKRNEEPQPFEIGIRKKLLFDLKQDNLPDGLTKTHIIKALGFYCTWSRYIAARRKLGNKRINLQGEPVDEVTQKQIDNDIKGEADRERAKINAQVKAQNIAKEKAKAEAKAQMKAELEAKAEAKKKNLTSVNKNLNKANIKKDPPGHTRNKNAHNKVSTHTAKPSGMPHTQPSPVARPSINAKRGTLSLKK